MAVLESLQLDGLFFFTHLLSLACKIYRKENGLFFGETVRVKTLPKELLEK